MRAGISVAMIEAQLYTRPKLHAVEELNRAVVEIVAGTHNLDRELDQGHEAHPNFALGEVLGRWAVPDATWSRPKNSVLFSSSSCIRQGILIGGHAGVQQTLVA